jgi:diacylglycerol O-acyltransferase / wax synthase
VDDDAMADALAWGGPQDMSAWEALMWRSEADPRTRSTGILLELLDGEPEWDRFLRAHDRATRRIPRLRERVVEPHLPLVQPAWSLDLHFDLTHHVQRMRLHEPGTHRQLLDVCEAVLKRPLDRARPPWEAVLVTGLEGGRSAYLLKLHHSLADGLGIMQLLALAHSATPEPSTAPLDRAQVRGPVVTSRRLLSSRVRARLTGAPASALGLGKDALRTLGRTAVDPVGTVSGTVSGTVRFTRSLGRMLASPAVRRSPLMANTGLTSRLVTVDAPLDRLKAAGKAAGGSVNDAYVAAFLGGLRRYHEHHDAVVDSIPIGMPVSLRKADQPLGGNQFAGVRFAAPLAEPDPAVRIRTIREFVSQVREEPAIGFLDHLSPALTKLPSPLIIELSAGLTTSADLNISNIPGSPAPVYLAGCEVVRMYPLGPRPGVAVMATMITYHGTCCLGLNVDAGVFPDLELLERCVTEGFEEVLALADPPAAKPARRRQPRKRSPR